MTERFECPNCGGRLWERARMDVKDADGKPLHAITGPLVCAICAKAEYDIRQGYQRGVPCRGSANPLQSND